MRKCPFLGVALLAVLSFTVPTQASAQSVFFGVGPTFPMGDYGDYANTGFLAIGGVTVPVGPPGLALLGEAYFGQNSHSDHDGDKTNPLGAMGGAVFSFNPNEGEPGVYVFGQAGIMVHKYSSDEFEGDSESAFGYGGGVGYGFPLGGMDAWVEGRYMAASFSYDSEFDDSGSETTAFVGLIAGVSIPIGGN